MDSYSLKSGSDEIIVIDAMGADEKSTPCASDVMSQGGDVTNHQMECSNEQWAEARCRNGGTCYVMPPYMEVGCECRPGWTGSHCEMKDMGIPWESRTSMNAGSYVGIGIVLGLMFALIIGVTAYLIVRYKRSQRQEYHFRDEEQPPETKQNTILAEEQTCLTSVNGAQYTNNNSTTVTLLTVPDERPAFTRQDGQPNDKPGVHQNGRLSPRLSRPRLSAVVRTPSDSEEDRLMPPEADPSRQMVPVSVTGNQSTCKSDSGAATQ